MKALNKIFIAAIAATAMTACNNELGEQFVSNNGGDVKFTMGIEGTSASRVAMEDGSYQASFESTNAVGIFVKEVASYSNLEYTYNGSAWTGTTINVPADGVYTYSAYYPYAESATSTAIAAEVSADQETGGYLANDYLMADYLTATPGQANVDLQFTHALSLVEVTLSGPNAAEDAVVTLSNMTTDATINLETSVVTPGTKKANVTMDKLTTSMKYRAIVPEQTVAQGTALMTIVSKGRTYKVTYNASDVKFEKGKYISLNVELGSSSAQDYTVTITSQGITIWDESTKQPGDASISVAGFNIPLPTDGNVQEIKLNWSASTPANQIGSDKAEGWYKRNGFTTGKDPVAITLPAEIGYSGDEQALTIKRFVDSNGGWNNNPVVFHSCTPLERGVYELSFEFKDDGGDATLGALGVGLSSSNDNKLFKMLQKLKTEDTEEEYLADWSRTLTIFTAAEDAVWTSKIIYFSLEKASTSGSSGSSAPSYSATTDDDVNKGVNIIFYNNKSGAETTLYVRNIKLTKSNFTYTEE